MSGIEVAGLAFGILPILVEVLKSYTTVRDKVRTIRRCTQVAEDVSAEFAVIRITFLNDVRWILHSIEDKQYAKNILEDVDDWRPMSRELNDQLNTVLQDSYNACFDIIKRSKVILEEMNDELKRFDILLVEKTQGESMRSAYKRLRKALKLSFDKPKYDKCLQSLRDRNTELCALRSQIVALQHQENKSSVVCARYKALPSRFSDIQNASRQLHQALRTSWHCAANATRRDHYAKLCLDAEVMDEVRLDLAITCCSPVGENSSPPQETSIWLYVQSASMSAPPISGITKLGDKSHDSFLSTAAELLGACPTYRGKAVKKKASSDLSQQSACRKKIRSNYYDQYIASEIMSTVALTPLNTSSATEIDLCKTKNICDYLRQNYEARLATASQLCLGYLESPQMYKHHFYIRDTTLRPDLGGTATSVITTIRDALKEEVYDVLEVVDRVKIAHKLALATLQYNETPWLRNRWRLEDLRYLGTASSFNVTALDTLHFTSQISQSPRPNTSNCQMDDVQQATSTVVDEVRYGINNTPLFFLGIALLEIAYWKPIEEKMTSTDENNQVFAARRLMLDRGAPLGPEYQKIAQKCLECNFGFGNKLSNKGLQSAVYNDVVCQLHEMIDRLEKLNI